MSPIMVIMRECWCRIIRRSRSSASATSAALAELFTDVLGLCGKAGLVKVGVIAIDGTKIAANASLDANRSYERIVREILDEARGDRPARG